MNLNQNRYSCYALCKEMMDSCEVIKKFNETTFDDIIADIQLTQSHQIIITGEGSSRIFPGKYNTFLNRKSGSPLKLYNEGSMQTSTYELDNTVLIGISNSGRTKELITLFRKQIGKQQETRNKLIGITANDRTPLTELSQNSIVLQCGKEHAVAATKSVIEQCLTLNALFNKVADLPMPSTEALSQKFKETLEIPIDKSWVEEIVKAEQIYFVGKNDGVAEELTLKTNEIARKKSDFLEGTYCVHGIEEVMSNKEVVILIDPYKEEEAKYKEVLEKGVGMSVYAISSKQTLFPTIKIPEIVIGNEFLQLAAGWNLLVEIGLELNINLDKTERARKIGNEVN